MPARIIWSDDHYVIEYSGHVVVEDSLRAYGELVGSKKFDGARFAILDCQAIIAVDYGPRDYDKHAAITKSAALIKRKLRIGLVVPSEEIEAEILPFMESVSNKFPHDWSRRIFRDYDQALAWACGGSASS